MRCSLSFLWATVVALAFGLSTEGIGAQHPKFDIDPAREKAALKFAESHHPELANLLKRLKSTDDEAYRKAVREVSQASERLTRMQQNDTERYEKALRVWTLDSRIRLLAARSTMSDDPSIDRRLRDLLQDRQQARLAMLKLDHQRVSTRLERIDLQIEQLQSDGDEAIDNELVKLKRAVTARRPRKAVGDRNRRDSQRREISSEASSGRPERKPTSDGNKKRTDP